MSRDIAGGGDLGVAIERYQAAVDDFDREMARILGVNETDLRCLEILIQEESEATPRLLAEHLGLTSGSVTAMLDRLEKLGYVRRSAHPSDRRKVIVTATSTAVRRAHDMLGPLLAEANERLITNYSAEQLTLVADFLTRAGDLQREHVDRLRQVRQGPAADR
jgi:DNA-binding MarR family transcriptional regulator